MEYPMSQYYPRIEINEDTEFYSCLTGSRNSILAIYKIPSDILNDKKEIIKKRRIKKKKFVPDITK